MQALLGTGSAFCPPFLPLLFLSVENIAFSKSGILAQRWPCLATHKSLVMRVPEWVGQLLLASPGLESGLVGRGCRPTLAAAPTLLGKYARVSRIFGSDRSGGCLESVAGAPGFRGDHGILQPRLCITPSSQALG